MVRHANKRDDAIEAYCRMGAPVSVIATALKHMLAAGMPHDAIVAAVAEMEAEAAPQRSTGAERMRRWRERHKASQSVTCDESDACDATPPSKERPPIPPKETQPPSSLRSDDNQARAPTPRQELERVLDAPHAAAVLDHRQRIRRPLTSRAAQLLAGKFARCQDPNAAADAMVANGWQGFEPDWMNNRAPRPNGHSPPAQPKSFATRAIERRRQQQKDQADEFTGPTLELRSTRADQS